MSLNDPRRLIVIIDELGARLDRWSMATTDHLAEAEATQRCGQESVDRTITRTRTLHTRAFDDLESTRHQREHANRTLATAQGVVEQAAGAQRRAIGARASADAAVSRCMTRLHAAEAELAAARHAEREAREARERAADAVRHAQVQLVAAQNALASARNRREYVGKDSQGNDIYRPVDLGPYIAAVNAAQGQLHRAMQHLEECEERLARAVERTRAAERRVESCRTAVRLAEQARAVASGAASWAAEAVSSAGQARADASSAVAAAAAAEEHA